MLGAVYNPDEVIDPHVWPEQPAPLNAHVTEVFVVPVTVATSCRCVPVTTCAVRGETVTPTGGVTVTTAEADLFGSATEVALTVT